MTLSGLLHCQFISMESKVKGPFEKLCKTALPNRSKRLRLVAVDGAATDGELNVVAHGYTHSPFIFNNTTESVYINIYMFY